MKAVLVIVLVVGAIVGLLFTLRTTRNAGAPSPEVLERAKERARAQAADEKDD
jgi:Protein of unknown function (DUF2897)